MVANPIRGLNEVGHPQVDHVDIAVRAWVRPPLLRRTGLVAPDAGHLERHVGDTAWLLEGADSQWSHHHRDRGDREREAAYHPDRMLYRTKHDRVDARLQIAAADAGDEEGKVRHISSPSDARRVRRPALRPRLLSAPA